MRRGIAVVAILILTVPGVAASEGLGWTWESTNGFKTGDYYIGEKFRDVAASPDGATIFTLTYEQIIVYSGNDSVSLGVVDFEDRRPTCISQRGMEMSGDGRLIVVHTDAGLTAYSVDGTNLTYEWAVDARDSSSGACAPFVFSSDSSRLYRVWNGAVEATDTATGETLWRNQPGPTPVQALGYAADADLVAAWATNGRGLTEQGVSWILSGHDGTAQWPVVGIRNAAAGILSPDGSQAIVHDGRKAWYYREPFQQPLFSVDAEGSPLGLHGAFLGDDGFVLAQDELVNVTVRYEIDANGIPVEKNRIPGRFIGLVGDTLVATDHHYQWREEFQSTQISRWGIYGLFDGQPFMEHTFPGAGSWRATNVADAGPDASIIASNHLLVKLRPGEADNDPPTIMMEPLGGCTRTDDTTLRCPDNGSIGIRPQTVDENLQRLQWSGWPCFAGCPMTLGQFDRTGGVGERWQDIEPGSTQLPISLFADDGPLILIRATDEHGATSIIGSWIWSEDQETLPAAPFVWTMLLLVALFWLRRR